MANSTLSRFVIPWQIPIPDHEFDLSPQREPNLTIDSCPLFILRQTLLRAVSMLVVGSGDPRTTFRLFWSSGSTTVELTATPLLDCWLLTLSSPAGLSEAS